MGTAHSRAASDTVTVRMTRADAVVGASQFRALAHMFAGRMPDESRQLLERIAEALADGGRS